MSYLKIIPSLEERASLEVALNLCQEDGFKAAALCLERPTYGFIHDEGPLPFFVTNPKKLLRKLDERHRKELNDSSATFRVYKKLNIREDHKKPPFVIDPRILSTWEKSKIHYTLDDWTEEDSVGRWYFAVEEQCQKLVENLPQSLKYKVCSWLYRIALEYISYCRRLEVSFGVSRYFLMNYLTRGDWTEACRIDEKKLAERLLKDTQLTILQCYHIACVYCLIDDIPILWSRLTENERSDIYANSSLTMSKEINNLIKIWSILMNKNQGIKVTAEKKEIWPDVVRELVSYGNVALLIPFWEKLEGQVRLNKVIDLALMCVEHWMDMEKRGIGVSDTKVCYVSRKILLSNYLFSMRDHSICWYNLRSYYSELILFFLLEMNEDQQLLFLQRAFEIEEMNILECFLHWPLRDYFLQTVNRLWGMLPMDKYRSCLVTLSSLYNINCNIFLTLEYSENYDLYCDIRYNSVWIHLYDRYCRSQSNKEDHHYDYRNLLWKLWEDTPQMYKQNIFNNLRSAYYEGSHCYRESFFIQLVKKSPFQKGDESLFKLIFRDMPETDRKNLIHLAVSDTIYFSLLEKENYSLATWFLQQCSAEDKIPFYKSIFIHEEAGLKLCIYKLQENRENSLLDLLDWSGCYSDSQKAYFLRDLVNERCCVTECKLLLRREGFKEVERIMDFCLSSDELKKQFKVDLAQSINRCDFTDPFHFLLPNYEFQLIDKILNWCFDEEEGMKKFKQDIFAGRGSDSHYSLVFQERWEDVNELYKFFNLSPEEVKKLKSDAAFRAVYRIKEGLFHGKDVMNLCVTPLRYCLTDEEMVINFKNYVEENSFQFIDGDKEKKAKERLSFLVKELLTELRKDAENQTSRESSVLKIGEKRSQEEESLSPKKVP